MPKEKISLGQRLRSYVREFGADTFSYDSSMLFCKYCEIKVNCEKRFNVTQHLKTEKHTKAIKRRQEKTEKTLQLLMNSSKKSSFNKDLCHALLSANIPLNKLSNNTFRNFLETYTGKEIPTEATLRQGYVDDLYDETVEKIKSEILNKKVWVSIDETTDIEGRYIANVVVGTLELDKPGKQFLVNCKELEKTNFSTISKLFDDSIQLMGIQRDNVLLFLSDAAPYMVKSGEMLKALYSKMIHVTCAAHGLHRVAEEIRGQFKSVDKLIASVKKTFRKAPSRVQIFKSKAPEISLPPEPVITRWGTWINAANYYCDSLSTIRSIFELLDNDDAVSIKVAKKYINKNGIDADLIFIKSNFLSLTTSLKKLQTQGLLLSDYIEIINDVEKSFETLRGPIGLKIQSKLKCVLEKNNGLLLLKKMSSILLGIRDIGELDGLPDDISSSDVPYLKFATITSVDVEQKIRALNKKKLALDAEKCLKINNMLKHFKPVCETMPDETDTKRAVGVSDIPQFENVDPHMPDETDTKRAVSAFDIPQFENVSPSCSRDVFNYSGD
ncbi:hypothetical protein QTP88_012996 [Uroleucon formosanum]